MNIKDWSSKIKQLRKDDVYVESINHVKARQVAIFTNPNSSEEDITRAHNVIIALSEIENYFDSVQAEEAVFDKRNK